MKTILIAMLLVSVGVCAMEMPKDEFLERSAFVVVAKMDKVAGWEEPIPGMLLVASSMVVEEVLRGEVASNTIIVKSYRGVTGSPELELDKRYVLFLEWDHEVQAYIPVNGVQGCWDLLEGDKLGGMGFGRTLTKLREYFIKHP